MRRRAASGDPCGAGASGWKAEGSGAGGGMLRKSLVGDILEVDEAAALADDVEEVSMLAGSGVCLMCS